MTSFPMPFPSNRRPSRPLNSEAVSALAVAADLADAMTRKGQRRVAEETGVSLGHLLDMIELKREFNRRVLRYLGYRRRVIYYRAS